MNERSIKGRIFRTAGCAVCLLAVLSLLGGHWWVLQSFAWARMLSVYARQGSLSSAFCKTFDGRHPCALCLAIQQGRQQEQQEQKNLTWIRGAESLDFLCEPEQTTVPLPPVAATPAVPIVPHWHPSVLHPPRPPPPRAAAFIRPSPSPVAML